MGDGGEGNDLDLLVVYTVQAHFRSADQPLPVVLDEHFGGEPAEIRCNRVEHHYARDVFNASDEKLS